MDIESLPQPQMVEQLQMPLSSVIRSLQEENTCPFEVIARLKEYEGKTDSMEDLPADLRWIVSVMLDRNEALIQVKTLRESECELYDKLTKTNQEKESFQHLAHEAVEGGLRLSEICDRIYENLHSLNGIHFTSGAEKASNLHEPCDEPGTTAGVPKPLKTQNETREKLGEYFRLKSREIAMATAGDKKNGRKGTKRGEAAAESTGEDLLKHLGEDDLWEPTYDGYESLEKYIDSVRAKTPKASDGVTVTWARCKPGHREAVVANVEDREVFYDIYGGPLPPGKCATKELELNGMSFRLIGYDAVSEIEMIPATAVAVKHLYPKYKAQLKDLDAENRAAALIRLQELLGPDVCVDGAKTAAVTISAPMMHPTSTEREDMLNDITEIPDGPSEADPDSKPDEAETDVIPPVSSEEETNNDAERPQRGSCVKISRRQQNKESRESKQQQPASDKDEGDEDRKKEEKAQKKRERERQRWEQKKKEKAEQKKAVHSDYKPSQKRGKQRMETVVHPASHKKLRPLISGKSYWSPSLAAYILFLSLSMMLPIYRIECASAAMLGGLNIPLSTLEGLSVLAFSRKLNHLLPYFYKVLNEQHYVHADETVIEVFRERSRKDSTRSYIWIYSTIALCPTQVRIYDYKPGRKGEFCKIALASFAGVLITDAYQGYNLVDGVQHAFCFIHARRKIYDAAQNGSSRFARRLACRVLKLIDDLFAIERELQAAGYDADTLARKRQEKMADILSILLETLTRMQKDQRIPSNGKLAKAVNYMLGHYAELTYFLQDGNVPMHNQVSEHAARRVSLYRNGSMFCGSPAGAEAFAGVLTVAETARANNLDVFKYFVYLFENMRGNDFEKDEELMERLLPWSKEAQAKCASKNPVERHKIRLLGGQVAI